MLITVSDNNGNTYQKEFENTEFLIGKQIGDEFEGNRMGLDDYTLEIRGGSDEDGFPMRESIEGSERRSMILSEGQGVNVEESGDRERRTVRGNRVSDEIRQLNVKVVESGEEELEDLMTGEE